MIFKKLPKNLFLQGDFRKAKKLTRRKVNAILRVYKPMFVKIALVFSWFVLAPLTIIFSIIFLHQDSQVISLAQKITTGDIEKTPANYHIDAQVLGTQITDIRPYIVSSFLKNTALEPYSQYIVEISDKYGIDYRLIPAIAMKESGGGNKAPGNTYNAWGFENGKTQFSSWNQAIETVAKTLKERYVAKGLVTPDQIMPVYAPPALSNGGGWAKDVNHFFSQMESL